MISWKWGEARECYWLQCWTIPVNHSTVLSVRSLSLVIGEMYFKRVCLTQILHILYLNLFFFFPVFTRIVAKLDFFFVSERLFCENSLFDFAYNGQQGLCGFSVLEGPIWLYMLICNSSWQTVIEKCEIPVFLITK